MTELGGRGAWSPTGRGGTLKRRLTGVFVPGPYYLFDNKTHKYVGGHAVIYKTMGVPVPLDYLAVHHGVIGIQALCSYYLGRPVLLDGVFDEKLFTAVKDVQRAAGLKQDGIVGKITMRRMIAKAVVDSVAFSAVPAYAVQGILEMEGALDPGAVGVLDPNDWGLAQINSTANPHVSFSDAFCPSFAIRYVRDRLKIALDTFRGNEIDAIVSYNLGLGGTRAWIAAGRPIEWTPVGSNLKRYPLAYADRIIVAGETALA